MFLTTISIVAIGLKLHVEIEILYIAMETKQRLTSVSQLVIDSEYSESKIYNT
jgi:hypothetical protein